MKMTPAEKKAKQEDKRQQKAARNVEICRAFAGGMTVADCAKQYSLTRKRVTDILRNQNICVAYLGGASLGDVADEFSLSRQRVQQILKKARVWRDRVTAPVNDRDDFLGINISEEDKAAVRAEAVRQGLSMSALGADWIKERLEILKQPHAEEPEAKQEVNHG